MFSCGLQGDPHKYQTFLQTRPKRFEAAAVSMLIDVLRAGQKQRIEEGFELHIAHLGNADMLPLIKAAKADGEGCCMRNSYGFCCMGGQQTVLMVPAAACCCKHNTQFLLCRVSQDLPYLRG